MIMAATKVFPWFACPRLTFGVRLTKPLASVCISERVSAEISSLRYVKLPSENCPSIAAWVAIVSPPFL